MPIMDTLDMILGLIREMEEALLGLKELRKYVGKGAGAAMLEILIADGEEKIAEAKRKITQ